MNKYISVLFIIAVIGIAGTWYWYDASIAEGRYDEFAQCLKEKNITMYGADWCPHCQNEKKAFGSSFQYVPYVECPQEPQKCLAAGIKGYPTWIFPDGRALEGEQGIAKLAQESGCSIRN